MAKIKADKFMQEIKGSIKLLDHNVLIYWSDGKKEVIEGITYMTTSKYIGSTTPNETKRYIKYIELLTSKEAKVLYGK